MEDGVESSFLSISINTFRQLAVCKTCKALLQMRTMCIAAGSFFKPSTVPIYYEPSTY